MLHDVEEGYVDEGYEGYVEDVVAQEVDDVKELHDMEVELYHMKSDDMGRHDMEQYNMEHMEHIEHMEPRHNV